MTSKFDPDTPTEEALQACLETLQQLNDAVDLVEEDKAAYLVFQAAQKLYKNVKKHRKYLRKQESEPIIIPEADESALRFRFVSPEKTAPDDVKDTTEPSTQTEEGPTREDISPPPAKARRGRCYVCNKRPQHFHEIYHSMCQSCGTFNLAKRTQSESLEGRVALLTGARVKIGFQIGLKLLRSGATLFATTRFPRDAARRYAAEKDADEWSHRLHILGLDLRHIPSVYALAETISQRTQRLDILVQNAAQTVRRPPAYYRHLMPLEQQPHHTLPTALQQLVVPWTQPSHSLPETTTANQEMAIALHTASALATVEQRTAQLPSSAMLSQVPLLPGDEQSDEALFPPGTYDEDEQQEDNRIANSWTMQIGDVPGAELWEVHTINAMAPFVLLQQLTPLLQHGQASHTFVIHVAAAEGQFDLNGRKSARHPHTNMSKAALNMLTRTCAGEYATRHIYVNSVDPGWVSYELPRHFAQAHARQGFQLPLDAVDGAARVLDPIYTAIKTGEPEHGKLWKDYSIAPW